MSEHLNIAVDIGNGASKWATPIGWGLIPSYLQFLDSWECKDILVDDSTRMVRYITGSNKSLEGKAWVIGEYAKVLGQPLYQKEKHLHSLEMVLGLIEPPKHQCDIVIDCLPYSVPDDLRNEETAIIYNSIQGEHEVEINKKRATITIKKVKIFSEGEGAFRYALKNNLIDNRYKSSIIGIYDIGAKTTIITPIILMPNGQYNIIKKKKRVFAGVQDLGQRISTSPNLRTVSTGSANIDLILEGIENGTYKYGTTGVSFLPQFDKYKQQWLDTLRGQVRTVWEDIISRIGQIIIVGGGAPLTDTIKESDPDRYVIPDNPRFANVRGLLDN